MKNRKYIATVTIIEDDTQFQILLDGKKLEAWFDGVNEGEISDGDFDEVPTDRECVERVFSLYNGGCGFEIADCIEYED